MQPWSVVRSVRTMATMGVKEQKLALRKRVAGELKKLDAEDIQRQCRGNPIWQRGSG